MRSWLKSNRSSNKSSSSHRTNIFPEGAQHPDLPLSPNPQARSPRPQQTQGINRSSSVSERFSGGYAGDRRSIAVEPGYNPSLPFSPDDIERPSPLLSGGLTRSQTVLKREDIGRSDNGEPPSPLWSPDFAHLPTYNEQPELQQEDGETFDGAPSMSQYSNAANVSSDPGQAAALDRWEKRRLQRLNTEQGFREQRSGAQGLYSPPASLSEQSGYNSSAGYLSQEAQPQQQFAPNQPPHPSQPLAYHSERSGQASHPNAGLAIQAQPVSSSSSRTNLQRQDSSLAYTQQPPQQYTPPDSTTQLLAQENFRPALEQSRSYYQQQQQAQAGADDISMSSSNNGSVPQQKTVRAGVANRQSMHNGINSRESSSLGAGQQQTGGQQGVSPYNESGAPPPGPGQNYANAGEQKIASVGRNTPQPLQTGPEMSEEDVSQLIKDHKELREKYTKVKKYYFEKEDQVKQLQNSLAHQRLSQSRTSLDDSEYTTRFNRLDGLVAQLAFSIRRSWRSMPTWLIGSVNKDAVATGKHEMTAAGRAFISCWLVEEVFDKYFHPDLDPTLSEQLKTVQRNIRRFAPQAQTAEEEEYLTSKVVNWRLSTLEGLQEALRSPQCPAHRAQLTDMLKESLIGALSVHLQEPAPSDLEGGVHMIIELVVSIAIHLPLESRDVVIEYFMPGYSILQDQMKIESGIPPLTMSIADDAAERASVRSEDTDSTENTEGTNQHGEERSKKRNLLGAITGTNPKPKSSTSDPRKHAGAGGSSSSLNRPDSSQGMKDQPPRVRMTAGIGVQIRGRSVLVKAPVFATS